MKFALVFCEALAKFNLGFSYKSSSAIGNNLELGSPFRFAALIKVLIQMHKEINSVSLFS